MIMMIIAELSGRRRQSPIVHGEEGQCLGTKDTLSIDLTEAMFTQMSQIYSRTQITRTQITRTPRELDPWIPPHFSFIFKRLALAPSQATTIVSTCGFSI